MRYILCIGVLCVGGCATARRPRWEVTVNINVTEKIDPQTTVTGGVIFRRPLTGQPLSPVTTPTPEKEKK